MYLQEEPNNARRQSPHALQTKRLRNEDQLGGVGLVLRGRCRVKAGPCGLGLITPNRQGHVQAPAWWNIAGVHRPIYYAHKFIASPPKSSSSSLLFLLHTYLDWLRGDHEHRAVWRRACIAHRGASRHELSFGAVPVEIFAVYQTSFFAVSSALRRAMEKKC